MAPSNRKGSKDSPKKHEKTLDYVTCLKHRIKYPKGSSCPQCKK